MVKLLLAIVCLSILSHAQEPLEHPQWPGLWTASWNEQMDYSGDLNFTSGYTYYDITRGNLIWGRFNGWADPSCAQSFPETVGSECQHVISAGSHYLYLPNAEEQCCLCCSDSDGCGIPTPSIFSAASYQGAGEYLGLDVYYWEVATDVYYVETQDQDPHYRNWVGLFSLHDNYTYVYDWTTAVNPRQFSVPSSCTTDVKCPGVCATIRGETQVASNLRSSMKKEIRSKLLFW